MKVVLYYNTYIKHSSACQSLLLAKIRVIFAKLRSRHDSEPNEHRNYTHQIKGSPFTCPTQVHGRRQPEPAPKTRKLTRTTILKARTFSDVL